MESNSISNQRDLIHSFLRGKSDILVCAERVDDGYSGIDFNRPAIIKLLEEVKNGEINCIIVKDLSRFGRNYIETGRYIQQIFPFIGVRFIAINDNYDSLTPETQTDNIILPFKNLMNDSYCRDISIKVRSQIEIRQKRGDYVGSFPVYGYFRDITEKGKLIIDEVAATTVRDIFAMRLSGINNRRIALSLNEHGVPSPMEYKSLLNWKFSTSFKLNPQAKWSPMAVERILKNEIYTGTMVQGKEKTLNYKVKKRIKVAKDDWVRVENTHEPIIAKEDFNTVQELMLCDTRTAPKEQVLYLFSGFLRCDGCGCNMVRRTIKSCNIKYAYYVCSSNKNNKEVCSSHRIREDYLSTAVLAILQKHIAFICKLEDLLATIETLPLKEYEVKKLSNQYDSRHSDLIRYQKLKTSVYEDYKDGLLSKKDYIEMKSYYEASCQHIESAIKILEREMNLIVKERKSHSAWVEKFKSIGNIAELNRSLLALSIEKITVFDAHMISIKYKYQDEFKVALKTVEPSTISYKRGASLTRMEDESINKFLIAVKEAK